MAARRYTLLDVFTSTRLQGNPLAVVHDADGVPDAVMHAFARETRLSETSFVQTPTVAGADYRNRIWMMSGEVPFAGHPSLGVAAAVARERGEASVDLHAGDPARGCSRSTSSSPAARSTPRCCRSRRRSGPSSIRPTCSAPSA